MKGDDAAWIDMYRSGGGGGKICGFVSPHPDTILSDEKYLSYAVKQTGHICFPVPSSYQTLRDKSVTYTYRVSYLFTQSF